MNKDQQSIVSGLWFFTAVPLSLLFLSAAFQDGLTFWHFVLACILIGIAVGGTPIILAITRDDDTSNHEKAKRERIDNMLRDMSDDELLELKKRLSDGDMSEDTILDFIGDDGELVMRQE